MAAGRERVTAVAYCSLERSGDPHGLTSDANEWKFLFYAKHEGGVLVHISGVEDIEPAVAIVRKSFSVAQSQSSETIGAD